MAKIDNTVTIYALAIIVSIIPLLFLNTPPLVDYGGHLGRLAIQLDAGKPSHLSQWYSFQWGLIPNLGTDLLVQFLSPWLELEFSLKLILIATVALQASGYIHLSRAAHGSFSPTVLLALPLVYNLAFHFGFLNFLLSMALATWSIGLWIKLGAQKLLLQRAILFALLAPILWITHLVGWAILLIYAGSDELVRNYRQYRKSFRTVTACILPCVTLLTPLTFYVLKLLATSEVGENEHFFVILSKIGYFVQALKDRWGVWDISSAGLIILAIYWIYRSGKFAIHGGLASGSAVLFIIYLLMPGQLLGSALADMRLAPYILATALIAAKPKPDTPAITLKIFTLLAVTFLLARTTGTTISLHQEDQQFQADLAILDDLPRGSNLISFIVAPCANLTNWSLDRRPHIPGYAIARRLSYSNDQWAMAGGQLLAIHNPATGPYESDPSQHTTLESCEGSISLAEKLQEIPSDFPYLWLIDAPKNAKMDGWRLVSTSGRSSLYARP